MRRLLDEELIGRIHAADATLTREQASALLRRWLLAALEDRADTETPTGGKQGAGGAIGSEVNGAVLDARSPQDLLLADDMCAAARHLTCLHLYYHSGHLLTRICYVCADIGRLPVSCGVLPAPSCSWLHWQTSYCGFANDPLQFKDHFLACRQVLQWAASSAGRDLVSAELQSLAAGAKARQVQQLAAPSADGEASLAACETSQTHRSA